MRMAELTDTERAVVDAFNAGIPLDLREREDPAVRAAVIRFLLLGGGAAEAGKPPLLWLRGALVTGALEVEYADVTAPIELHDCRFDGKLSFFGSRLRRLGLQGSTMPELM